MTNFKCPVCKRTFSTRSGYSQHTNVCIQVASSSDENDDDNSTMDINETLLESEKSFNSIEVY
jgi:hypothetical protein